MHQNLIDSKEYHIIEREVTGIGYMGEWVLLEKSK